MINPRRGEVEAVIGGRPMRLCLTLGALAWLEHRLGLASLVELGQRFSAGNFSTDDLIALIAAGLHGGDEALSEDDLWKLPLSENLGLLQDAAVRLLSSTFTDEFRVQGRVTDNA